MEYIFSENKTKNYEFMFLKEINVVTIFLKKFLSRLLIEKTKNICDKLF